MAEKAVDQEPAPPVTTLLALDRTRIAYERTMMAWTRTATSFITFGFAVYKFFEIETAGRDIGQRLIGSREFAMSLIALGVLTLLIGTIEHGRDLRTLKRFYPGMPVSGTRWISAVLGLIGVAALLAALFKL